MPTADDLARFGEPLATRLALTTSCRVTDAIEKVDGAGGYTTVGGVEVQVMHNGVVVERDGYLGPWQSEVIARLGGHHEPQEELVFHAILERLATTGGAKGMVELGAWWAYYLLWFKHRFPAAVAIGVEPDLPFLELGRRNAALNGLELDLVHGVVGPSPGTTMAFRAASDFALHEVEQYSLAQLLERAGLERFDVVLADIQGAEHDLVATSAPLLAEGKVRFLVVSTHDLEFSGRATTHQEICAQLRDLGGHLIAEHSVSESFSGDGLVAVSFDDDDADFTVEIPYARAKDSVVGEWEPRLQAALDALEAYAVPLGDGPEYPEG